MNSWRAWGPWRLWRPWSAWWCGGPPPTANRQPPTANPQPPTLAIALLLLATLPLRAEPRPLHDAEREAVGIAAAFLDKGPEALWARLAKDAPLRRLGKEEALAELAVRAGPREEATWTLRTSEGNRDAAFQVTWPSGYADGLLFRMQREGGRWALAEVVTLAEVPDRPKGASPAPRPPVPRALVVVAALFLVIGLVLRLSNRPNKRPIKRPVKRARHQMLSTIMLATGAALVAVAAFPFLHHREKTSPPLLELRALLPLRTALARGADGRIPAGVSAPVQNVATLWVLESGATAMLNLASAGPSPLAELVRARLALDAGDEEGAWRAFARAAAVKPVRDDVLHEAAFSLNGDHAKEALARMRALGSRDAEVYYGDGSYEALRTAWLLEPRPRAELVRDDLLTDLRARSLVSYYSALEPVRRSQRLSTRPLDWPTATRAFVTGEHLRVEIANAALEVPNGAELAPRDAQVVPATHGARRRDAAALRDAQELLEKHGTAPRTRLVRAVTALARHHRWTDVLALTGENAVTDLIVLRMRALLHTGKIDEARALAETDAIRNLHDPAARLAIGEALGNAGQWNAAEALFRSVDDPQQAELVALRLRRLALRRALATTAQLMATEHFAIRYDTSINPAVVSRIGELLEAELARLRRMFPPVELRRVAVNVLRWEEFRGDITQSDHILGLYDGEILFPFAAVAQFKPEVVAVITHELTHAILAQATADNAPRWFQEGVATRMELVDGQENAFRTTAPAVVLPVALLDAVMEKNSDPEAYVVAQTFIRFLEDTQGPQIIARLTTELARGTGTDDALTKLTGKSLDAINTDFRQWGFHHNGDFMSSEPWPYARFYSPEVDPRIKAGFKLRRDR
ncbi:MAG: basic secretory protein-like protein [Acidobacteriota bacterium]